MKQISVVDEKEKLLKTSVGYVKPGHVPQGQSLAFPMHSKISVEK
jgi:hypothetical protein